MNENADEEEKPRNMYLDERIKDFDRTLLGYLVNRMDRTGTVHIKQRELAEIFKTRKARISATIGRLRKAGYVTTESGIIHINLRTVRNVRMSVVQRIDKAS